MTKGAGWAGGHCISGGTAVLVLSEWRVYSGSWTRLLSPVVGDCDDFFLRCTNFNVFSRHKRFLIVGLYQRNKIVMCLVFTRHSFATGNPR
ncbi:MAG: hypothetical protein CMM07_30100 [Rhodopirellula sp.]|nr:hypothetical protein [Rhodopirellula sp.]